MPDMTGKVAIVTGGSAGVGLWDALWLAQKGAKTIILSTTESHGREAEQQINERITAAGSKGSIAWHGIEFRDPKATHQLMEKLKSELDRLDVLIVNAGIGQIPFELTKDGLGSHYAIK